MARTNLDEIADVAGELFFKQGYAETSISQIVQAAGISETTFRRYFIDGKVGVYWAVMQRATRYAYNEYMRELEKLGLNPNTSDPKEIVITYIKTIFKLWHDDPSGQKWQISLLYGQDFAYEIGADGKHLITDGDGMIDINALDDVLLRGCGGNKSLAQNVACIILGTLREYVLSKIDEPYGYDRSYDRAGICNLLELVINSSFTSQHVIESRLTQNGVSIDSLQQLNALLTESAKKIDSILLNLSKN